MSDLKSNNGSGNYFQCSFCGKSQEEVRKLIAGPSVFICNGCIQLCQDILQEEFRQEEDSADKRLQLPAPKEIASILDDYVIGQKRAKKALSVAIYNHYKRLESIRKRKLHAAGAQRNPSNCHDETELAKSNILLIGSTGSGKTLLAETLARLLHVPFTIVDATTLTEAGYVGEDVENILQKLLQKADGNVERAQMGMVYIDEIDKINRRPENPSITRDVSGEGVQQAFLKLLEGATVSVPLQPGRKHPNQETVSMDTSNILFICGGAFSGLEKIVRNRKEATGIGFVAAVRSKDDKRSDTDFLQHVEPTDLIKYGLIPEFVGRLPVVAVLDDLDAEALVRILTEPKNALVKQYTKLFFMDGVELEFREDALEAVAKRALEIKTGARGLRSILENVLLDVMYELPSMVNVSKVVIDLATIQGESSPLILYKQVAVGSE